MRFEFGIAIFWDLHGYICVYVYIYTYNKTQISLHGAGAGPWDPVEWIYAEVARAVTLARRLRVPRVPGHLER
jgi:hypothetical protein